jgi:hypothetical protein
MSEIRRLRDETRSGFVHALLVSTDADCSETGACDRALAALGAGAASAIAASAAAKAAAVASNSATGATIAGSPVAGAAGGALTVAPAAAKGGAVFLVKWAGIALLGGVAAVGTAPYALHVATRVLSNGPAPDVPSRSHGVRSASPSVTASHLARVESRLHSPPDAPAVAVAAAPPSPGDSPDVPMAMGAAPTVAAAAAAAPAIGGVHGDVSPGSLASSDVASGSLPSTGHASIATDATPVTRSAANAVETQLAALSAVRTALARGDPQRALALLDEFDRRNPFSPLTEEVTVLRVDALVDAGRVGEATALAEAFLSTHPASVYGGRIRSKVKSP